MATCTCNKPKLLHKPCSHVYKACAQMRQMTTPYISEYYDMQHLLGIWSGEFHSYDLEMNYKDLWPNMVQWGPNKHLKTTTKGRRQTRQYLPRQLRTVLRLQPARRTLLAGSLRPEHNQLRLRPEAAK